MRSRIASFLVVALAAHGFAAGNPPQAPLRAAGGPMVALWQKTPNPNKPYIAQLFAPGDKPVPLLDDSPADHFHHHGLMFALNVDDTDLMMAHAANPRPGEWFTMGKPFCYLSATLNLKNEPFMLAKGESWTLRYSLAVLSTPADHARLANLAAAWKSSDPFSITKP